MFARAFIASFYQLRNNTLRRCVWLGLAGSAATLSILIMIISILLLGTDLTVFGGLLSFLNPIIDFLMDMMGLMAVLIVSWFLFPSIACLVVGFYLEDIAQAVETEINSELPQPRVQRKTEIVAVTCKFAAISLLLNILVFPVYVILLFFGPLNLLIYYTLNGYLIGREFFELVAHRRLLPAEAVKLRQKVKFQLFLSGVMITFMMTLPIVNLIAPVIAVSVMVYLVDDWNKTLMKAQER